MAVSSRIGAYGIYFGSTWGSTGSNTLAHQKVNATYIWNALREDGWTLNAVAAILGNMQAESSIQPGRWEGDVVGRFNRGYGLVQWTPATKYTNWIGVANDPSTMDNNLKRIKWEVANNKQWIRTKKYPITFKQFKVSIDTPENLGAAFLYNYERPKSASSKENYRRRRARFWYDYLYGIDPPEPTPTEEIERKKFKWVLYARKLRNNRN